jgi:hypothetical protein
VRGVGAEREILHIQIEKFASKSLAVKYVKLSGQNYSSNGNKVFHSIELKLNKISKKYSLFLGSIEILKLNLLGEREAVVKAEQQYIKQIFFCQFRLSFL